VRRRSVVLAVLIVLGALATVAGVLGLLLKQEPAFYAAGAAGDLDDGSLASGVLTRFGDLRNDIREKPEWSATFTAGELNAFLRRNLEDGGWFAKLLPPELSGLRVAIDGDRLKIAGRAGEGLWSTVLSMELRVWLVKDEVNTVAVELIGMWAGALPVEVQWFRSLDSIAEDVRDSNVDVNWYRHNGHLVGVFRFYADQPRPPTQIRTVQVEGGRVTIAGRSMTDPGLQGGAAGD
jgi:hypothetical protein